MRGRSISLYDGPGGTLYRTAIHGKVFPGRRTREQGKALVFSLSG
jgi:hypothetical protein